MLTVGSTSEKDIGEAINPDVNLAGMTTFSELAPVLKRAKIVIGNDSGPLYLASAVGTKTVGIYGPSSPKLVGPFSGNHRSVSSPVWCQPCYHPDTQTRGNIACQTGSWACMLTIRAEDIISEIDDLLRV